MMSKFGFSTDSASGDFLPIVKYDARAGRMFRIDRDNVGGEWVKGETDITKGFKAILDLSNIETGWIAFGGGRPDFALVPMGSPLPPRPAGVDDKGKPLYSNGVRFMLKLSKGSAGDKPAIREIAGVSKAFLKGIEDLHDQYEAGVKANPGKLPVVVMEDAIPIKSSGGGQTSTNYQPVFKIESWADRGDLVFQPKNGAGNGSPASSAAQTGQQTTGASSAAQGRTDSGPPSTGSTRVEPPKAKEPEMAGDDSDFG